MRVILPSRNNRNKGDDEDSVEEGEVSTEEQLVEDDRKPAAKPSPNRKRKLTETTTGVAPSPTAAAFDNKNSNDDVEDSKPPAKITMTAGRYSDEVVETKAASVPSYQNFEVEENQPPVNEENQPPKRSDENRPESIAPAAAAVGETLVVDAPEEFIKALKERGLEIREQAGDGNCLFRAISLQIYGDSSMHGEVRKRCLDFMVGSIFASKLRQRDTYLFILALFRQRKNSTFLIL